ncbi:MAG: hypothetical protein NTX00_00595 [Candidatus Parcubacteria bacterium]|nr:hypothetical protein [Candidatus Parcubacteria bacterium]
MAEKTDINKEPSFLKHYKVSLTIANGLSVIIGLLIFLLIFGIAEAMKGYELDAWWPVIITAIVAPFLQDILKKRLLKLLFKGGQDGSL